MKKILSMLCVVLVVGFAGTAFAAKAEKVDVCHNGSVYDWVVEEWVPGSFVINISENAVGKHVVKHGDTTNINLTDEMVTTEVHVIEGETDFEEQPECIPDN
jgi:hypothetical protein